MLTAGKSATRGRCGAGEVIGDGGAVQHGDEIGQPDGVGVVVGVVLGKNGEMGTMVPRQGYIYPAHWSRLVLPTGTKG